MTVGLALLLDLTSRLPRAGAYSTAHSHAGLSAAAFAATAAAAFSSTGVPLSARHLFRFVCPSPAPSPPWFSFTGGTFCFCNAELTPEQKAELVMSLKVL